MKNTDQAKLITLIEQFLDVPQINAARHQNETADNLACQIETLLDSLGLYVETDDGQTVLNAAALLGRRGGLATSEKKREAVRENGKRGGRPRSKKPSAAAQYRREYRERNKKESER